ncbi:alpha/beta hydrolase [Ramlibacter tataouinensis]|uniref:alpha/beta fold hydrolase n=1 Tax=Ramlibacter tataouinensis TaxID=94132 RepID=UPI0022F3DD6C|nr:alpha/beta hydrolase [Ramlibacter tataouinensis]WBY02990.1 alpha/beta hydrolase [Ramlibacter tataouinensis]
MPLPPLSHELPAAALRVLSRATAIETVHGATRTVWHAWGDAGSEPLVLLHGGSGSWTHWLRNVEALAASGRRVIVPDLPGFGDSAAAGSIVDADGMVEPVSAGLREVVGGSGAGVVGFSFGGLLAGLIAAAYPELVRRLVLAGAPALGIRAADLQLKDWRHLQERDARDQVHRDNLRVLMLHDPASIDDFTVRLHAANLARDRVRRRRMARTDVLARTLSTLRCRVDGIWGRFDQLYAGKVDELRELLGRAPNFGELVLVPHAGHWVQYENAASFNEELLRLLAVPTLP